MSSNKEQTRLADKTVRVRQYVKAAIKRYISDHYTQTGEHLTEGQAVELIFAAGVPAIWGELDVADWGEVNNGNNADR